MTPRTVINITSHYRDEGLEKAIKSDPIPGRPPVFDDRIKSEIVALVCSQPPEGFDRWTLDILQEAVETSGVVSSIGKETLRLILHEHDLKPWQYKMWCIGEINDEYIQRMEDILDLYAEGYSKKTPLVFIDEKPVTLNSDIKEPIPMESGSVKKVDYEYQRNGSINVFSMVEPKAGRYINKVTETKTSADFAELISDIADYYQEAEKIKLVLGNYSTQALIDRYGEKKGQEILNKFEFHFTPIHASWLNQAEIAIGMYQR